MVYCDLCGEREHTITIKICDVCHNDVLSVKDLENEKRVKSEDLE